jgi:hypothetical protein
MKAINLDGTIKTYSSTPKSWGNVVGGFDTLSDSDLESYGFYDVIEPTYDGVIQEKYNLHFDSDQNTFVYDVKNKTITETLAELKIDKINQLNSMVFALLQLTDWYAIRKAEKGTDIPSDIQARRDELRTNATTKEGEINALTTKASVLKFDINL